MKRILSLIFTLNFILVSNLFAAQGKSAMVVTADARATRAALQILHAGGNAVDAAIVAQWVLNVVEPQSSGIGGGGFFMVYDATTKKFYSFDGREKAPGEAHAEMFYDENGDLYPFYPERITGGLPVGVPGTLKLLEEVHARFGSKKFAFDELFDPAIELAGRGIQVSPRLASHLAREAGRLELFPSSKNVFFNREGEPLKEGDILFQPDLAKTFRLIKKDGTQTFYEGEVARAIVRAVRTAAFHPGVMVAADLEEYQVVERFPVRGNYRGFEIISMGPPSSGGSTLIEALNILEVLKPTPAGGHTAENLHLLSEAQRHAFIDRNNYLGDPDFSEIPLEKLMSKTHAKYLAEGIDPDTVLMQNLRMMPAGKETMHTSHMSIVDAYGNMVSFTTTIESVFGSGLVVPGYGFVLNNELTDFEGNPKPKGELHPNAPESDKRPRSSMTPTFVMKEDKPMMIVGTPGGSTIIGTVFNLIVNVIDFHMSLADAMRAPRMVNRGEHMDLESHLFNDHELKTRLLGMGHQVKHRPVIGNAQAILFDLTSGAIVGESDPRGEGLAAGY